MTSHKLSADSDSRYIISVKNSEGHFTRFLAAWRDKDVPPYKRRRLSLTENVRKAMLFDYHDADAVATRISMMDECVVRVERVSDSAAHRQVGER